MCRFAHIVADLLKWKMAAEHRNEDYPEEIDEQLTSFDSSVSSVKTMLEKLMSIPRNEQPQKVGFTNDGAIPPTAIDCTDRKH